MKKLLLTILFWALAGITALNAQDFTVGPFDFIVNEDSVSVTVAGHIDCNGSWVGFDIPETVTYDGIDYTVTAIGDGAFFNCVRTTGPLTLPNTITYIGDYAFAFCYGLTGDLTIPNSVTYIGERAFYLNGYNGNLTIGNSVITIGEQAFAGCSGLTGSLNIPNSVTTIGKYAFANCSGLTGSLSISNSLLSISDGTFKTCSGLTGPLNIPYSIYKIGEEAFAYCSGLSGVLYIHDMIYDIGDLSFTGCSGFEGIVVDADNPNYDSRDNCNAIIKTNDNILIFGCANSTIPNSVVKIGEKAFDGCWGLKHIEIANSVTEIGNNAFNNSGLLSVHLSSSVNQIWHNPFTNCRFLEEIVVDSLNSVYDSRNNCNAIIHTELNRLEAGCKNTVFPDNITTIGYQSFLGCTDMTGSLIIPESVTLIGTSAFSNCSGLDGTLFIPSSVTTISSQAFYKCNGFKNALSMAVTPPSCGSDVFTDFGCHTLTVPCESSEEYGNWGWYQYFDTIVEDCATWEEYPLIGDEWYYEITNENGSVTYQYLECATDTTINTSRPKVIVKNNTLYDKGLNIVKTHEYVYSDNDVVFWWDKQSQSYTTLYNFNANVGDEWTISVGNQSITMHVDAVNYTEYNGNLYRIMTVSDENDIFGGDIICGIGHTKSFFPERLLSKNKSYRVDGMRCYWVNGEPIIQFGDVDCDEIYEKHHKTTPQNNGEEECSVYPNPAGDNIILNVNQPSDFTITDITGKIVMQGAITSNNQQINISELSCGMYFIKTDDLLEKFIKK